MVLLLKNSDLLSVWKLLRAGILFMLYTVLRAHQVVPKGQNQQPHLLSMISNP